MHNLERLETKVSFAVTDEGLITGQAWFYGEADRANDTIVKGAFGQVAKDLPILFQHEVESLIGTWSSIEEGPDGLQVKGQLHMDHPRARAVLAMIKSKLVDGLSIGFRTKASTRKGRGPGRVITAVELAEVSVVRDPSHPRARITSAKTSSALAVAEAIRLFTASI